MLATLSPRVVSRVVLRSCRARTLQNHASWPATSRDTHFRPMTTSSRPAAASDEQQTGSLEQMSVTELQELLSNPVLVSMPHTLSK